MVFSMGSAQQLLFNKVIPNFTQRLISAMEFNKGWDDGMMIKAYLAISTIVNVADNGIPRRFMASTKALA